MSERESMKTFVYAILLLLPLLAWSILRIVSGVNFDRNCEGYLKRAADASTVAIAKIQLDKAIEYIDKNGLTRGYTSIFYTTPDEDIGFWYNNIKSARTELQKVTAETTLLEKTNILMKLRETLLDNGETGSSVTVPNGISIYPNNVLYFWFGLFSLPMFIVSGVLWIIILVD
jgi:hypothetical protein